MNHVLVIDDDPFVFAAIEAALDRDAGYELDRAGNGEAGLAAALARPPDVVLLDIELPGQDGYAVCRALREQESLAETMIVFVSGHGGPAQRLAAYDAGGDDFVVKPFSADELQRKIALVMRHRGAREALRGQAGEAMQMAMAAMSDAGAIGVILNFFRESLRVHGLAELAGALLRAVGEYGLDASARLSVGAETLTINTQGRSSAMEGVLLASLADSGERIVSIERKLMVAYPRAILLVKNMPVEDAARCGRLRDHLAMLVEGVEDRIGALAGEMLVREVVRQARDGIDAIDRSHRREQSRTMAVMDTLMRDIERVLPGMGLTIEQENRVLDPVEEATREAAAAYDEGLALDGAFAGLRRLLDRGDL